MAPHDEDLQRLKLRASKQLERLELKARLAKSTPAAFAMTGAAIQKAIAANTGLTQKAVKGVFTELQTIAFTEVAKTGKFVIPKLVVLKLTMKKARLSRWRVIEGLWHGRFREVTWNDAKPAKKVVKAFALKPLKDNVNAFAAKALRIDDIFVL
jgi:hypothetical protein